MSVGGSYRAMKAGLTSTDSRCDVFIPLKYRWTRFWFMPTSALKSPMGSLPKLISMEKLNELEGI